MADHYIAVGILRKPHGLNGAFGFLLSRGLRSLKKWPSHFFIEQKGTFVPYFVEQFELKDFESGYISFEGINNPEQARKLSGCDLCLNEKEVSNYFKKAADDYSFLIGYTAWNRDKELGSVAEIYSHPAQILAAVELNGREVLIPLADELVLEIDKRRKKIIFEVPEGLLDL